PNMKENRDPDVATEAKEPVQDIPRATESSDSPEGTSRSAGHATNRNIKIVAIDLQPMTPLEGITTLCADITHPSTIPALLRALDPTTYDPLISPPHAQHPVDLVLS